MKTQRGGGGKGSGERREREPGTGAGLAGRGAGAGAGQGCGGTAEGEGAGEEEEEREEICRLVLENTPAHMLDYQSADKLVTALHLAAGSGKISLVKASQQTKRRRGRKRMNRNDNYEVIGQVINSQAHYSIYLIK